ncbi:carboxypeptidase regulatory-like domain-containing protein [Haloterrigena sp. SYSU A558-1]|uniref:Carboxypeptidase regulatory-like domain-containing protein n=1 Tax=Haloterrigena gelatinilytica TaxID=2741724 RepID=A0A8J8KFC1_9EURY|nr:carboxypeptidase regulatory-like domain-containing protein [Haloterrigena gelatinilytica]NUB91406.1 carboxypeptidase regulatory-like domain-containing protein [Haloterrigena gelatinilytica]NUC72856.1 carboxypeptidase regulatory-like domain-containing protein [Haloterrigena gelatinilytica]
MRGNTPNRRTEDQTTQKTVQILLTVCGIVLLALGLVLAASGTSINSAIGSVSDELGGSGGSDDTGSTASDDSNASAGGNETVAGDSNNTDEPGGSDSGDSTGNDGGDGDNADNADDADDADDGATDSDDGSDANDDGSGSETGGGDETHTLTTTVVDADGAPVDGATVTVAPESDSSETQTVDATGEAEFDLEDGEYEVTANADGYEAATGSVTIDGNDKTATLTLESTDDGSNDSNGGGQNNDNNNDSDGGNAGDSNGMQTLTVVAQDDEGDAVNDATVTVEEDGFFSSETVGEQDVNDDGEAEFDLEDGEYEVTANANGYEAATDSVTINGNDKTITLTLEED